jgi:hypothetical protein
MVSCSNGTRGSRQSLSFLPRWRQPQPRNRISREEERQPRAPRRQHLRRTQRLPLTQRLHRDLRPRHRHRRQESRRRWPHREQRHTSPHHVPRHRELRRTSLLRVPRRQLPLRALHRTSLLRDTRLRKLAGLARRKRPALRRSTRPARPEAHPRRSRRGTRPRPGRGRLPLSNSRKPANGAAAAARELRSRANSKICRNPGQAALRHRPGAAAATRRHNNKTWLRNRV